MQGMSGVEECRCSRLNTEKLNSGLSHVIKCIVFFHDQPLQESLAQRFTKLIQNVAAQVEIYSIIDQSHKPWSPSVQGEEVTLPQTHIR